MTDALQNPHPEVPFARVGDDTILAIIGLAAIFKLKLRQSPSPTPQAAPPNVTQRPCLAESSNPILDYLMPISRQTRSQTTIQTQDIPNTPLPPRVVIPRTLNPSPPRVPTRSQRLTPQLVPKGLLRNGHRPHGHRPRRQPLVSAAPSKRRRPSRHRKRNGIHGTYEGSPDYNHFGREDLATNADASSKAFGTFLAPTHVSLSDSLTSRKTERSLTAK
jgi:hypothetical protein